jgi:hypothetical protein
MEIKPGLGPVNPELTNIRSSLPSPFRSTVAMEKVFALGLLAGV